MAWRWIDRTYTARARIDGAWHAWPGSTGSFAGVLAVLHREMGELGLDCTDLAIDRDGREIVQFSRDPSGAWSSAHFVSLDAPAAERKAS